MASIRNPDTLIAAAANLTLSSLTANPAIGMPHGGRGTIVAGRSRPRRWTSQRVHQLIVYQRL